MTLRYYYAIFVLLIGLFLPFNADAQQNEPTHPLEVAVIYNKLQNHPVPFEDWINTSSSFTDVPDYAKAVVFENEKIVLENLYKNASAASRILAFDEVFISEVDHDKGIVSLSFKNQSGLYLYAGDIGSYTVSVNHKGTLTNLTAIGIQGSGFSEFRGGPSLAAELYIQPISSTSQEEIGRVIKGHLTELRLYTFEHGRLMFVTTFDAEKKTRLDGAYDVVTKETGLRP